MYSSVLIPALAGFLMHKGCLGYDYMDSMVIRGVWEMLWRAGMMDQQFHLGLGLNSLLMY